MDYNLLSCFVHGIILARILALVAVSFPRDETHGALQLLCWQADSLLLSHLGFAY